MKKASAFAKFLAVLSAPVLLFSGQALAEDPATVTYRFDMNLGVCIKSAFNETTGLSSLHRVDSQMCLDLGATPRKDVRLQLRPHPENPRLWSCFRLGSTANPYGDEVPLVYCQF